MRASKPEPSVEEEDVPARRYFQAGAHDSALREARALLAQAPACRCCATPRAHVFDRIGGALFLDDDPVILAEAFDAEERETFTPRLLAAAILLEGRPRTSPWGPTPVAIRPGRAPSPSA